MTQEISATGQATAEGAALATAASPSTTRLMALLAAAPAEDLASLYRRHGVEEEAGPMTLAQQICLDGSNTIASLFRGWEGVPYLEVARDVARKLEVDAEIIASEDERVIEQAVLGKVIERYIKSRADAAERAEIKRILTSAGIDALEYKRAVSTGTLAVVIAVLRQEIVAKIVQGIVARAGVRAASGSAARLVGLAVPLLNLVLAAWTVFDLSGPAFRKTVPSIIEVALIRIEQG